MHVLQHVYRCLTIMPAIIEIKSYTVVNGTSLFVSCFYPSNTLVAQDSLGVGICPSVFADVPKGFDG